MFMLLFAVNGSGEQVSILSNIPVPSARSVAVKENIAYIVGQSEFVTADITDAKNPKILGRAKIDGVGYDIELKGDYAFIAARLGGIHVYKINEPSKPQYITTYDTIEQATGLGINGNILLCCNRMFGLELIDISNPEKPEYISKIKTAEAQGVASKDNYAYVGEHYLKALTIIDISNPANPKKNKSVGVQGNAWGVVIKDNYAYVATGHKGHGVCVVDISDPQNAKVVDSYKTPEYYRVGPDCWEVGISGNNLFLVDGDNGLFIFDITQPDKLKLITSIDTPGYAHNLAIKKDIVLVADYDKGVQLILAEQLAGEQYVEAGVQPRITNKREIGVIKSENIIKYVSKGQIRSCFLDENYIYVAVGTEGLEILSIKNPGECIGKIKDIGVVYDVVVQDNVAYVSCGSKGLKVVDIENKENPKVIGNVGIDKLITDLYLVAKDKLIARTSGWGDANYIDITDLKNPKLAGSDTKLEHFLHQVADTIYDDTYAVAVNSWAINILKLEKNERGHKMDVIYKTEKNSSSVYEGAAFKDKYLYATTGWLGQIITYNFENPLSLQKVSELKPPLGKKLYKIFIDGSKGYITTDDSVIVINLENPSTPEFLEEVEIPGIKDINIYKKVIYKNNYFYICTGYSGLWIYQKNK